MADRAKWFTVRLPRTIALVLAVAVAAGGCSSGDSKSDPPAVTGPRAKPLSLTVTAADLVSADKPMVTLDEGLRTAIEKKVQRVLQATVVTPLTTGKGGNINALFTNDAAARANADDRAVMFDENQPRMNRVVPDQLDMQLTALAGADGGPVLVVAKLAWRVHSPDGTLRIERQGELSFTPGFGNWLVSAYEIAVTRIAGDTSTTTTAVKE